MLSVENFLVENPKYGIHLRPFQVVEQNYSHQKIKHVIMSGSKEEGFVSVGFILRITQSDEEVELIIQTTHRPLVIRVNCGGAFLKDGQEWRLIDCNFDSLDPVAVAWIDEELLKELYAKASILEMEKNW
ncbi:MAG: hypothetical protein ACRCXZ_03060 [Patescibacteria group bacterium]